MSPPLLIFQAVAPRQGDWQKVGLALAGVVVGVLLEPVRVWIAAIIKRRQIRRLLYRDVARINDCLDFASDQSSKALKENKTEVPYSVLHYLGEISLDVYSTFSTRSAQRSITCRRRWLSSGSTVSWRRTSCHLMKTLIRPM